MGKGRSRVGLRGGGKESHKKECHARSTKRERKNHLGRNIDMVGGNLPQLFFFHWEKKNEKK